MILVKKTDNTVTYNYANAEERNKHVVKMCTEEGYICIHISGGLEGTPLEASFEKE